MNDLKKAIWSNFVTGYKAWYEEAPENTPYPYCVWQIISDVAEDTFTEEISDLEIQINVFSDNKSSFECDDIAEKVIDHYKKTLIPVDNHYSIKLFRILTIPAFRNDGAWQSTISFQGYIEKE
ncbi:MAG: DUF3168 domain-containing protein [Deltaproteobacteria bacterium]|nr:DUF3168 domain-containing protein [Deltaproteobacteria bacterium]